MAQVLKADVRDRIEQAALQCFAERGYRRTSMADIAALAGTTPGNVYRYFASKEVLLASVIPQELPERHDRLLDARVEALAGGGAEQPATAAELLDFWLGHRWALVVLLDRAEDTPFADYPTRFVDRLVGHVERSSGPLSTSSRQLLTIVFDNTRRAVAEILRTTQDPDDLRTLVAGFWSYQVPGLEGLLEFVQERQAQP